MFESISIAAYFKKASIVGKLIFSKKGIALIPFVATMPILLTSTQQSIAFLILLMIADFVTGIGASISRRRKLIKSNPQQELPRLISSGKLKKSGVKFLLYSMTILTAYGMQVIFQLKTFTLPITNMELSFCIGVVAWWCIVEFYSIFFENFKDMGIDIKLIIKKITTLINFIKDKSEEVCTTDKKEEE
jgi:hypothetical protein